MIHTHVSVSFWQNLRPGDVFPLHTNRYSHSRSTYQGFTIRRLIRIVFCCLQLVDYDYTGKVQPSTDVLHTTHVCNISGAHCNGDVNVWCIHYLQHFIITQAYIQCDGKILHKYVLYVKLFVVTFIMHVTCIVNVKQFRKGNSGNSLIQVRCRVVCTIACIPRIRVQCPTDFSRKGAARYLSRIYRNIMYYLS